MKAFIIIVLLIVVALIALKPNEDDFYRWYKSSLNSQSNNLAGKLMGSALSLQMRFSTEYNDYYIFAIVTTKSGMEENRFLGIAKTWIKI